MNDSITAMMIKNKILSIADKTENLQMDAAVTSAVVATYNSLFKLISLELRASKQGQTLSYGDSSALKAVAHEAKPAPRRAIAAPKSKRK